MADIGNQLEGAAEGLDRFLDALDTASMKMGSNAAIEARVARDELRSKAKITKQDKVYLKNITDTNKNMKLFNKNLTDFGKKILGGLGKSITNIAKAGVLGGMVGAVKLITDGEIIWPGRHDTKRIIGSKRRSCESSSKYEFVWCYYRTIVSNGR